MIDSALLTRLRCPVTGESLREDEDGSLINTSGSRRYPVVYGIPDFRLFDPPYMTREEELRCADRLDAEGAHMSYQELVAHFEREIFPHARKPAEVEASIEHRTALLRRSPGRLDFLLGMTNGRAKPHGLALDLGCGSGEATAVLRSRGADEVIGVDISLAELMLARKLLSELGQSCHLVAGCAEALPFVDNVMDFIYSPDVIEHVSDQPKYLSEARRVLRSNGQILLNSPNRYAIFCPEPHTGIWLLGFAPRPWMDGLCRIAGRGHYVGKRLVSLPELRSLLRSSFGTYRIYSRRANSQATSLMGRLFFASRAVSEPAYSYVCDQHVVLVEAS